MNIISAAVVAFYLSAVGIAGTFAIEFVKDYADMNTSIAKSLRTGDIGMQGSRQEIAKACGNSAAFLSTQGYAGVRCDVANSTVKF
jgi:hypothetical protein